MNNRSPLRYPGGKTRACKIIESEINKLVDINSFDNLISPFFGGGSFEFYIQNKYGLHIIANDKFKPLYEFWNMAKHNNNELCNCITHYHPIIKETFSLFRNQIMSLDNSLSIAAYYFIINRCSFSGSTLSGGFSKLASEKRFTKSSIDRVKKLNLSDIDFYNLDFEDFFITISDKDNNSLYFLDPPYYLEKKSKLYGYNGDIHESFNHKSLSQNLQYIDNWVLCYNDCEYIRELYKNYTIVSVKWNYGMNKTKKSSEILILNISSKT